MLIHIINGTYGFNDDGFIRPKTRQDDPFEVPDAEAKRLVELGVAEYATKALANQPEPAGESAPEVPGVNTSEEEQPAETPLAPPAEPEEPAPEDCIDIVDGHMTVESLMKMTRANMEALAEDLGLDVKKCKNKSEIAALIAQVEVGLDEQHGEGPELTAAVPT
jgi:hypothetical protein